MEKFKDKSLIELCNRINEIEIEKQKLNIEYNMIIEELWNRIPSLKDDENLQKVKIKRR